MELFGKVEKTLDAKGRLSIPKKLREGLLSKEGDQLAMLFFDECVQIFPWSTWLKILDAMRSLPMLDPLARLFKRVWGENVEICELDAEGRIVFSKSLKEMAGIDRDVMIIGAFTHLEVWAKERHEQHLRNRPSLEDLAQQLAAKGISLPL